MNPEELDGRIGEGWGGTSPNGAHINAVLARRGSATAAAAVSMLAHPSPGHTPVLVCVGATEDEYEPVWPPTLMMNKATATDDRHQTLTWGAAHTTRIRVATRVLGVPYRSPAMVAKMAETLDRLSAGRLILGLGGGYSDEEFQAFGLKTGFCNDAKDSNY